MILKYASHRRAQGPLAYALQPSKSPQIIAGSLTGRSVDELAVEIDVFVDAAPGVGKPVDHVILSFGPGDWDRLREGKMEDMLDELMAGLGYGNSVWVAVVHHDTNMVHVSIIASGVDAAGHRIATNWQGKTARPLIERLEQKYDLVRTGEGRHARAPNRDHLERDRRLGQVSYKEALRSRVDVAIGAAHAQDGSMLAFARALREQGVTPQYYPRDKAPVQGIAFAWHPSLYEAAFTASGTQLGRGYTWPGLQRQRGLSYDVERDRFDLLLDPPPAPPRGLGVDQLAPEPIEVSVPGPRPLLQPEPPPAFEGVAPAERLPAVDAERVAADAVEELLPSGREASRADSESAIWEAVVAVRGSDLEPQRDVPTEAPRERSVAEAELAFKHLETELRALRQLETQRDKLESAVASARQARELVEGRLRGPHNALLEHFYGVYRDGVEAVSVLRRGVETTDFALKDLMRWRAHRAPERLGSLLPRRGWLGERPADPGQIETRLQAAAPTVQTFIAAVYAVREARRVENKQREKLREVGAQLTAGFQRREDLRRQLVQQIDAIAPGEHQWARWRSLHPTAAELIERELERAPEGLHR